MRFSFNKLRKRTLQSTYDLMQEVGDITTCGKTKDGNILRYAWKQTGANILAVAHCDTVNCGSDHFFYKDNMVWSSRLDDRLGVYTILDILPKLNIKIDVLLTDFEEQGMSTAQFFDPGEKQYNWIFQFDRSGVDAVHYQYVGIKKYLSEFFDVQQGSFSDIFFMDHLGICGFNVGTAYYREHSLGSYANLKELGGQIRKFQKFYKKYNSTRIPYIKRNVKFTKTIEYKGMSIHTSNSPVNTNFYY